MPPTHVTDHDIDRFCGRELHPADLVSFTEHVGVCDECRRRLRERGHARSDGAVIDDDLEALIDHVPEDEIQAYVDQRLDAGRRVEIARHLDACPSCAAEIRDLKAFAARHPTIARSRMPVYVALVAAAAAILAIGTLLVSRRPPAEADEAGLTARQHEIVRGARSSQRLPLPPVLSELTGVPGRLMGGSDPPPFHLVAPIGTAVLDDRPTFSWTPMPGAEQYAVTALDATTGESSTSPPLTAATWTPTTALVRGRIYVWQVSVTIDGRELIVPAPPAPPARFLVLDASTASDLERLPPVPLVRGILYADAGLLDAAARELAAVPAQDTDSGIAVSLLQQLRAAREGSGR